MNEQDEPIAGQQQQLGPERPLTKDVDVVNLNTATVEELSRLPGVGAKLAGRIIEYRTKVHPFREPAEITQVRGISAALGPNSSVLLIASSSTSARQAPAMALTRPTARRAGHPAPLFGSGAG